MCWLNITNTPKTQRRVSWQEPIVTNSEIKYCHFHRMTDPSTHAVLTHHDIPVIASLLLIQPKTIEGKYLNIAKQWNGDAPKWKKTSRFERTEEEGNGWGERISRSVYDRKIKGEEKVMRFIPLVHFGDFCERREDPWCDSTSDRMSLQKLHTITERGRGDVSIIIFSTHCEMYWLSLSTSAAMAHPALLYINSKLFLLRYSSPPTKDTNRARAIVPE